MRTRTADAASGAGEVAGDHARSPAPFPRAGLSATHVRFIGHSGVAAGTSLEGKEENRFPTISEERK